MPGEAPLLTRRFNACSPSSPPHTTSRSAASQLLATPAVAIAAAGFYMNSNYKCVSAGSPPRCSLISGNGNCAACNPGGAQRCRRLGNMPQLGCTATQACRAPKALARQTAWPQPAAPLPTCSAAVHRRLAERRRAAGAAPLITCCPCPPAAAAVAADNTCTRCANAAQRVVPLNAIYINAGIMSGSRVRRAAAARDDGACAAPLQPAAPALGPPCLAPPPPLRAHSSA
jgi:hypothetical protein